MKYAKIAAIAALVGLGFQSASYAIDYGAELKNVAGYQNVVEGDWYTEHRASIWATVPFGSDNKNSFAFEGSFNAEKPFLSDEFTFYANVDLFRFTIEPFESETSRVAIDLGRFPVTDLTGIIINQTIDGAEFRGSFEFGNLAVFAGYTGFLNARETGAAMSADDYADMSSDAIYALGAKRGVAKATVHFPEFFGPMDFFIEGLGQFDMRDIFDSASETVHTAYGTVMVSGPVTESVFLTATGTFQTGIKETTQTYSENAATASLRVDVFPLPKNSFFGSFLYTTAEGDVLTTFLPITEQTPGVLYGSGYTNVIKASAGWYYNPFKYLNFDLIGNIFFQSGEVPLQDGLYRATEINAGATFKAASDLNLRFSGTVLIPSEMDTQYQAEITAIFGL